MMSIEGRRIGPGDECPDYLFEVRYIDIVVDHDCVTAAIGSDAAHGGDMAGLASVAGITLVDGNHEQEPRAADLVRPSGNDARDASFLDILAQAERTTAR